MNDINPAPADLKTAAEQAAAELRTGGILGTVVTNVDGLVMYHLDHQFIDFDTAGARRPQADVDRIAWDAMMGLTAHGVAWTDEDVNAAHENPGCTRRGCGNVPLRVHLWYQRGKDPDMNDTTAYFALIERRHGA